VKPPKNTSCAISWASCLERVPKRRAKATSWGQYARVHGLERRPVAGADAGNELGLGIACVVSWARPHVVHRCSHAADQCPALSERTWLVEMTPAKARKCVDPFKDHRCHPRFGQPHSTFCAQSLYRSRCAGRAKDTSDRARRFGVSCRVVVGTPIRHESRTPGPLSRRGG
jgi:hypothetical protein